MRSLKWISPVIVGLGLAIGAQAVTAGLLEAQPGACKPVQKVEPLPPACERVRPFVPLVKPCEPVKTVNACEPARRYEAAHLPFVFEHLGYKIDRVLHVTAHGLFAWEHRGYVKEYSPAPCKPVAPVSPAPASAPATLPAAPAPPVPSHS